MYRQTVRTDIAMINSGQWARIGRKQYQNAQGVVIRYINNDWVWEIVGGASDGMRFTTLDVTRYEVERVA